ncbi:MAG: tetratricopeptide repeat protein [Ferruginibacter sp.]
MLKKFKAFILLILIASGQAVYAQANVEVAAMKAKAAIKLEDEQQKYDDAIRLLREAIILDPDNIFYPYEIAYACSKKKDFSQATDILEGLLSRHDVFASVYQALGNAYDEQGMREKAIKTYEEGVKKFPDAGELYLELGNMQAAKKDYDKAIVYYEKGIEKDPRFPSNYYWAAKIFSGTDDNVWGMLYGEIFLNLERGSTRATEISKMLFNIYKRGIRFNADSSISISFNGNAMLQGTGLKDTKKSRAPFAVMYERVLSWAVSGEKKIDINSLDGIRSRFVNEFFRNESNENFPNILFDYQKRIRYAGHLEAYNHWILMKGDEQLFKTWLAANRKAWVNFFNWQKDNPLQIDSTHKFYRKQY